MDGWLSDLFILVNNASTLSAFFMHSEKKPRNFYMASFFPGGQSDHGYDSLSKEEERMCVRESDNVTLMDDKGPRLLCEL